MKKLTLWGSIASIVGLFVSFVSMQAFSEDVTTLRNKSPAISNTQGDIHINYGDTSTSSTKTYVLRESQGGQPVVLKSPHTKGILDSSQHVCNQILNGTRIKPLEEIATQEGLNIWRKVEIIEGKCSGRVGWVMSPDISKE